MKNIITVFGCLLIVLPVQAKYGGGSGTAEAPYLICDANHMNTIGTDTNDWDAYFILVNDINLVDYTGTQFNIIGNESIPFAGVFDGNDHTISNFTYSGNPLDNIGLFGGV